MSTTRVSSSFSIGDLVRPIGPSSGSLGVCYTNYPVVQNEWVGIVIDFESRLSWSPPGTPEQYLRHPIVYWNVEFQAEVEDPEQIEVVNEAG
jgi:hypothetical protein